jgi:hypothetical protein
VTGRVASTERAGWLPAHIRPEDGLTHEHAHSKHPGLGDDCYLPRPPVARQIDPGNGAATMTSDQKHVEVVRLRHLAYDAFLDGRVKMARLLNRKADLLAMTPAFHRPQFRSVVPWG